jgi:tetratricopeptide (TPR) repeat protein
MRTHTFLAILAVFGLAGSAAVAAPDTCFDSHGDPAALKARIAGCTSLIAAGQLTGTALADVYLNRGIAQRKSGKNAAAAADYSMVISLQPERHDGYNGRCFARALMGKLKDALADCNKALSLSPADPYTLDTRGFVNLRLGFFAAAIADYDGELAQDQKFAESYFGRGVAKLRQGDKAGGKADLAEARALDSGIDAAMAKLGVKP